MKRFLKLGFLFLLCTLLLLTLLMVSIESARGRMCRLSPEVHTVFLGNSHFANGIDDSQIPGTYNWGRKAEHPDFVYAKAKLILKYNPQVDTIFISFDDLLCFQNTINKEIPNQLIHPFLLDQFTLEDWSAILHNSSSKYWQSYFPYPFSWTKLKDFRHILKRDLSLHDCSDLGGYDPLEWTYLERHLKTKQPIPQGQRTSTTLSVYFVNQTIALCRQKHVAVLFLCVPQYPHLHYDKESYKKEYQRLYSDIPFLDYMNLPMADSCFSDLGHLSSKGARVFSRFLNQQLHPQPETSE